MPPSPGVIKFYSAIHRFWYEATGGLIGGNVRGLPILLLTTTGRKSGRPRTTPLIYLRDGDNFVVVASNGGHPRHPSWWLNLKDNPNAEVRAGRQRTRVRAKVADDQERSRLWPLVVEMYRNYENYQRGTKRKIPVVILEPER